MMNTKKRFLSSLAVVLALAVVVGGSAFMIQMNSQATAEGTLLAGTVNTAVSSPFTAAVELVKGSVVGVNNYQKTSSYNNGFYFGFGDFGFGNGNGRGNNNEDSGREVLYSSGSGVVIASGYVLTNYHVVDSATSLEVAVNDQNYTAELVGSDPNLDIAILKVDKLALPAVTLGDSDQLHVGDWAICIGNPLSFTGTTTVGVVSALDRQITDTSYDRYGRRVKNTYSMIQTDAAINAGNSGGGMFNIAGELVGVPTMKYSGSAYSSSSSVEGIGMSIPINSCKPLIDEVLGNVTADAAAAKDDEPAASAPQVTSKPRIGVSVYDMNASTYGAVAYGILPTGAYVGKIEAGSPAEAAGIKVGDIIVDVDDEVITSGEQMASLLQAKQAGDTVKIKLYRVEGLADIVDGKTEIQQYSDIPDGEYIDLTVELKIFDDAVVQ